MKICSINGCEKKVSGRGWCSMHYCRWKRTGDLGGPGEKTWKAVPCKVEGCNVRAKAKGYCPNHYRTWHMNGDPLRLIKGNPVESYKTRTERSGDHIIWTGNQSDDGYGIIWADGKKVLAHRWAYSHFVGEIPDGMFIDHICHNKSCVNPNHLRLATPKQNCENPGVLRSDNTSGYRGVYKDKGSRRWIAEVWNDGIKHRVGRFDTAEDANDAVVEARNKLFTHNVLDRI